MRNSKTLYLCKISILTAISVVLMFLEFPLPFLAPGFYKLDFSELPVLIGGFALGPLAALLIEGVKVLVFTLLHGSQTAFVGEISNFFVGLTFVLPAVWLYRTRPTKKRALMGLGMGSLCLAVFGSLANAFVLLPAYAAAFGMPLDAFVAMGREINPAITDLPTLILLAVFPFNLLKGVACSALTFLLYKKISPILKK